MGERFIREPEAALGRAGNGWQRAVEARLPHYDRTVWGWANASTDYAQSLPAETRARMEKVGRLASLTRRWRYTGLGGG